MKKNWRYNNIDFPIPKALYIEIGNIINECDDISNHGKIVNQLNKYLLEYCEINKVDINKNELDPTGYNFWDEYYLFFRDIHDDELVFSLAFYDNKNEFINAFKKRWPDFNIEEVNDNIFNVCGMNIEFDDEYIVKRIYFDFINSEDNFFLCYDNFIETYDYYFDGLEIIEEYGYYELYKRIIRCIKNEKLSYYEMNNIELTAEEYSYYWDSEKLVQNKKIALALVSNSGYDLINVDKAFLKDKEVVMTAMKNYESAFEFADESLKNDPDMLKAIEKYKHKKLIIEDEWDYTGESEKKFQEFIDDNFNIKIASNVSYSDKLNLIYIKLDSEKLDDNQILNLCSLADYSLKVILYSDIEIMKSFFDKHRDAKLYLDAFSTPNSIPNAKFNGRVTIKNNSLIIPLKILPDKCPWCMQEVNGANFRGRSCDLCDGDLDHGNGYLEGRRNFYSESNSVSLRCLYELLKKYDYPFDIFYCSQEPSNEEVKRIFSSGESSLDIESIINYNKGDKIERWYFKDYLEFLGLDDDSAGFYLVANNEVVGKLLEKDIENFWCCFDYDFSYYFTREPINASDELKKQIINVFNELSKNIKDYVNEKIRLETKKEYQAFLNKTKEIAAKQRKSFNNIIHGDENGILNLVYNQTFEDDLFIADDVIQIGNKISDSFGLPKYCIYYEDYYATFSTMSGIGNHYIVHMSDSVKSILPGGFAFKKHDGDYYAYIDEINISKNVKKLYHDTFDCFVKKIYIPNSVKEIEDDCFLWVPDEIFYDGTSESFKKICNEYYTNTGIISKSVVHCTDKDIVTEHK